MQSVLVVILLWMFSYW